MTTDLAHEALKTFEEMIALRKRIVAGEAPWSALADYFTEDAVYIDSAWGRYEGRDAILTFMDASMAGLNDWVFPEHWTMADGDRVVSYWSNILPGKRPDGSAYEVPGISGASPVA